MDVKRLAARVCASAGALTLAVGLAGCSEESTLFDISVGDCFNSSDITSEKVLNVEVLGCRDAHDIEVYAAGTMEGDEFPGRDPASAWAESFCYSEFEGFVGLSYEQSALQMNWFYPTADTWNEHGDREVLCLLQSDQPVTSSLRGSAR
ncbi:MAG: septum formation family protein [bacterium]|nr:septum formation family protein [bacterium]